MLKELLHTVQEDKMAEWQKEKKVKNLGTKKYLDFLPAFVMPHL